MEKKAGAPAIADFRLDERLEEARGDKPPEVRPAGECVVCRGPLVPDEQQRFAPQAGSVGVSPYRKFRDGWYCERCGLRYHHLPSRPNESDAPH